MVGVDRVSQAKRCTEHGADVVVEDVADLLSRDGEPEYRASAYGTEPWRLVETG